MRRQFSLLILASLFLFVHGSLTPRQIFGGGAGGGAVSAPTDSNTNTNTNTNTASTGPATGPSSPTDTATSPPTTPTSPTSPPATPTSPTTTPTSNPQQPTQDPNQQTSNGQQTPSQPSPTPPTDTASTPVQTDTATSFTTVPGQSSTSPSASSQTAASDNDDNSSSGFGTGSIIGLSVAGGVAVLGIVGFFVWKFTRKRFSGFDDNEAIKWPELNSHGGAGGNNDSHPLPVHNTGRAGFDTGSELSLSHAPSEATGHYTDYSQDPYAVPPLPHLNPNQPYRDDPSQGYYDPYRGPVPNTLDQGTEWHQNGAEAIPMTQMGRASPGPALAYDAGRSTPLAGRMSPGPAAAMAGRSSPGPAAAYDVGAGRASPGPGYSYGRSSPGPQAAYDTYGQR